MLWSGWTEAGGCRVGVPPLTVDGIDRSMSGPNPSDPCPCGSRRRYKTCCMGDADSPGTPEDAISRLPDPPGPSSADRGPDALPSDLRARVAEVDALLDEAGFAPPPPEREARMRSAQRSFEAACRSRWREVAGDEADLMAARQRLEEVADAEASGASRGYTELQEDLADPVDEIGEAGETGVPHLGITAHNPSLVGLLTLEAVAEMDPGPRRNRLLVEALFTPGTDRSDAALRAGRALDPAAFWSAFEAVVTWAAGEGHELQGIFWTEPFQDVPASLDEPIRPTPRFGDALRLLHEEGHLAAFSDGLFHVLDPSLDEPESVRAFLEDEGVKGVLKRVRDDGAARVGPS